MLNKGPFIRDAVRLRDDILTRMQSHQTKKRAVPRPLSVAQPMLDEVLGERRETLSDAVQPPGSRSYLDVARGSRPRHTAPTSWLPFVRSGGRGRPPREREVPACGTVVVRS